MKRARVELVPRTECGTSSRDTTEPTSSRDTTECSQPGRNPKGELLRRRVLIADMGHSCIQELATRLETVSFSDIAQCAEDQQAGLLLLTGVKGGPKKLSTDMQTHLPDYQFIRISTTGSCMVAAWQDSVWISPAFEELLLCGSRAVGNKRTALKLTLQRRSCDASPLAENEDALTVLLTKFHQGTAANSEQFDSHLRFTAWKNMLDYMRKSPRKWIIAGGLAATEISIAQRLKECSCQFNPSRIMSDDKSVACLTVGLPVSKCANHTTNQLLIIDMPPQDTVPPRVKKDDVVPPRVKKKQDK